MWRYISQLLLCHFMTIWLYMSQWDFKSCNCDFISHNFGFVSRSMTTTFKPYPLITLLGRNRLPYASGLRQRAPVLTTERELVSRPPSWPNMLGTDMPDRSIPCRWKGCSPFWETGGQRWWYVPDSDSGKCASMCSGRVGGVIGGMLKSSSPRLGTG